MFSSYQMEQFVSALYETLMLTFGTGFFVLLIGLMIGSLLYITKTDVMFKASRFRKISYILLSTVNDILRSIPFIILLILLIPVTRMLVGTMLGAKAALPALIVSASPFFGRVVFNALMEVPSETIEALNALGTPRLKMILIIFHEALSALVSGFTLTLVTLVGFMSAAAVIGAGGLAFLAYEKGKFGNDYPLMYLSIATLLFIVFIIQISGDYLSKKLNHK